MSSGGEKGTATTKTPADFLKSIHGRPVVVNLNSGVDYRGEFNKINKIINNNNKNKNNNNNKTFID
ncbi:hypothetical protein K2173_015606 [Erythroxylum novogranatense]|uniref:LSM domain-containing protein n=1 Tax=Erythroxylum novogranatense TaxID=1862640 RepID=A0AAV8SEM9_9ROSI|nr:hypothetical protein K2173_015606 [Erythroxylum novogranatense]